MTQFDLHYRKMSFFWSVTPDMPNSKIKKVIPLLLQLVALEECVTFIASHFFWNKAGVCFFEFRSILLWAHCSELVYKEIPRGWLLQTVACSTRNRVAFLVVLFRAGVVWALNTFPLRDANTVLLTLQEPFDDFAYGMVRLYLTTTIPQALIITGNLAVQYSTTYTFWTTNPRKMQPIQRVWYPFSWIKNIFHTKVVEFF